jgi:hypothetical protein
MTRTRFGFFTAITLSSLLGGCESSSPGGSGQVSFNVSSTTTTPAGARPNAAPDTLTDGGGNVLVLAKVELVLRDIEFKRLNHDACDSIAAGDDDGCEEFDAGPLLIDLPLNGGVEHQFSIAIDSGTYSEIELKLHKPEDDGDSRDRAFLTAHPDLEDVSVRVSGTFNGTAFTFVSDMNADQEFSISPPLVVTGESDVSVTLKVDVTGWFTNGLTLINPALGLKGGAFESQVESNIEASFEAFHDDDRDGHSDDD